MSTQLKYQIFKELVLSRNEFKHTLSKDGQGFSFSLSVSSPTEVNGYINDNNTGKWIKLSESNWELKISDHWVRIYPTLKIHNSALYKEIDEQVAKARNFKIDDVLKDI